MAKAACNKKTFYQQTGFNKFTKETSKVVHLEHSLCRAENWTLWKVEQKYLESFEMWCWKKMESRWTDHVKNEEVLHNQEGEEYLHILTRKEG